MDGEAVAEDAVDEEVENLTVDEVWTDPVTVVVSKTVVVPVIKRERDTVLELVENIGLEDVGTDEVVALIEVVGAAEDVDFDDVLEVSGSEVRIG